MSRTADPADLTRGLIIASKYRLEQPIGRGGMGIVFRATHLELSFNVAIKVLTSDIDSADARDRFLREAKAAAQIRSEHAARVFDFGSLPSGAPFIVMECLEGVNLRQYLRQRGKVPTDQAVSFILQACRAVAEAHALGIIHRDIKPSNLFLCERDNAPPVVKVLDFGISKTLGGLSPSSTSTGSALVGSPQYMSPERLRSSAKIDATVDVWAFGAVLYELLSGTPAFAGETVPALLASIIADEPEPLLNRCPNVARHIVQIVDKCLQKDPSKRYANALELLQALAAEGERVVQPRRPQQPQQQRPDPASSDYTKVQPGFADTTLMLSPSDIELLSESQPASTTTIEPLSKDATAKTKARTLTPTNVTKPHRARTFAYAGLAAASLTFGAAALRVRLAPSTHTVEQQADSLRPLAAASVKAQPETPVWSTPSYLSTAPHLNAAPLASMSPSDERAIAPSELSAAPSSSSTSHENGDVHSPKTRPRKSTKASKDALEPRPASPAKKPKKSAGTELFSDIH